MLKVKKKIRIKGNLLVIMLKENKLILECKFLFNRLLKVKSFGIINS